MSILEDNIEKIKTQPAKPRFNSFFRKMKPKYEALEAYLGITRRELYHNIYIELENAYGVDIEDLYEEYCFENNLNKNDCYPMDAIISNKKLKDALVILVDGLLTDFGLMTENNEFKRKTLFDDFRESNRQSTS